MTFYQRLACNYLKIKHRTNNHQKAAKRHSPTNDHMPTTNDYVMNWHTIVAL